MNRQELVQEIAAKSGSTKKQADLFLKAFTETVQINLSLGEKVALVGFGTFQTKIQKEKAGRNPQDGSELLIPAKTVVKFSPGEKLKEAVKNYV